MDARADSLDMIKGPKTPALRHYFEDFKSIGTHDNGMTDDFTSNVKDAGKNAEDGYRDFLAIQIVRVVGGVKVQDLNAWMAYYQAHDFAFLGNAANYYESNMDLYWETLTHVRMVLAEDDFYTIPSVFKPKVPLAKAMQRTLTQNPTICLQPQYLNQEAKAVCLQIFKQHTYNPKPLQKYLNSLRLISIDNAPCVYLNSKDKLQSFKSDNAICLALQKNLEKGLK
ncbi:hypothetical protein [Helicobacter felis]|nr:hypothetical protein [Helicobacter felis]